MLADITLGQFYPADSFVHKMDPRVKIVLLIVFIVGIFLAKNLIAFIPAVLFVILAARMSRLPVRLLIRSLKPLRFILIFTFILNIFFLQGNLPEGQEPTPVLDWWIIHLTAEGILQALLYSLRLIVLVLGSSLLTLSTSPIALTDGLEMLMTPLKVIRFPAHEIAMMMSIALRFIPTLLEEADKIMKAQTARGADFESGNILKRAKAMIPLLVPLFVSAFRRAGDLAMAMEARCYHGGEGRTRLRVLKCTWRDLWGAAAAVLMVAGCVLISEFVHII
ncbi:MAG: transporter [Clostridiales bacterium]|nr:transporter [Clostridiales bacterium]